MADAIFSKSICCSELCALAYATFSKTSSPALIGGIHIWVVSQLHFQKRCLSPKTLQKKDILYGPALMKHLSRQEAMISAVGDYTNSDTTTAGIGNKNRGDTVIQKIKCNIYVRQIARPPGVDTLRYSSVWRENTHEN